MFYELLVGAAPFAGQTTSEIVSQHLHARIPQLPDALSALQPVLDRLLAKDANARYGSADELIDALRLVFLASETLRQQIGYAGSEAAWSSQLRALGFSLGGEARIDVRIAQGDILARRTPDGAEPAVTEPMSQVTKPLDPVVALKADQSNVPSLSSAPGTGAGSVVFATRAGAQQDVREPDSETIARRSRARITGVSVAVIVLAASVTWWLVGGSPTATHSGLPVRFERLLTGTAG
jgi:hypothetical protein